MAAKVPPSLTSQENEDDNDDDRKRKMPPAPALSSLKNLLECSPVVADRIPGEYWKPPVQGTRSRKSP